MNRIVVVGASAGGLATAEALRRGGHQGAVTLVGAEPHLPYDRPPLSKQVLTGEWAPERLALRGRADIDALDLDLRLGTPAGALDVVGRTVTLADGAELAYDALVVATGVRPRRLTGGEGVHTLRTVEDALALKERLAPGRRLVIVGAGFVGAEVAAVATGLGVEVTLLEAGPLPMAQAIGAEAGRYLAQVHRDHGVDLRTEVTVQEIVTAGGAVTGVRLADGTVLPADDVLVAIGGTPNTEWLTGSGLTVHNGLVCDRFSTAGPNVHGVGDVACWHNPLFDTMMRVEHRTNAAEQGIAVARNLLNPDEQRPFAPVPYFWSDQYDLKIQACGHLRDHDEALVVEGDPARARFLIAYRRANRLTGVLAVGLPPKALRSWRSLIAAATPWETAISTTAA